VRRNVHRQQLVTGINITPLTDIALELLIVFMIATPMLMQSSINVNLPKASQGGTTNTAITILVDKKGKIFVNDKQISFENLKFFISGDLANNPDRPVVINGDREAQYDTIVKVLDTARQAGARKLSLGIEVTQQ